VHYWRVTNLMRDEEERFLRQPECVFPKCGDVLIFECDPSAFVHCRDAVDDVFAYKYDYVPRIFSALDDLLDDRVKQYVRPPTSERR
jgi:hypothetical protein